MTLALRLFVAAAFVTVGVLHFTHADVFVGIMPPFIPAWLHLPAVHWSGVFEIAGGVGILVARARRAAGWGLLALLVAVFPANIHMAVNGVGIGGMEPNPVALWLRLPLQLVIAWLVWRAAELGRRRGA